MDILVLNSKFLITLDQTRRIIENGALAIDGGKIVYIGKTEEVKKKYPSADRVIDASHHVITPGLMNCHCHTMDQLTRGLADNVSLATWISERVPPFEAGLTPDDAYVSAAACFLEAIKNGVTTLADPGGPHMDQVVQAVDDIGARAILAERLDDIPHRGGRVSEAATPLTEEAVRTGEAFVKRYNGSADDRVKAWFSLRTERTTSSALGSTIKRLADQYNVGIETHMVNTLDALIRHKEMFRGKLPLKRYQEMGLLGPNLLLTHCNWLTDEEVALVKTYGPKVCATPATNFALGSGGLKRGTIEKMMADGVPVALGCSGSSAANFLDMLRVAYCLTGAQDVHCDPTLYSPETLLEMLTLNGAKALLLDSEIGSLEVGKRADIVMFRINRPEWVPLFNPVSNLILSSSGDAADTVIIDGKMVMENRRMNTIDEDDLLKRAQKTAEDVADRTGTRVHGQPAWKMV